MEAELNNNNHNDGNRYAYISEARNALQEMVRALNSDDMVPGHVVSAENMFSHSLCLAPMIRASTLPLRLLALDYGADLVWSEEIVASKIVACSRFVNDRTGTVDFIGKGGSNVVFQTHTREAGRCVFQIGAAQSVDALRAAETVLCDIAAVDINMGCNKHAAVSCGMGASLAANVHAATDIVKTLHRNLSVPVSCKIRLQASAQRTVDLALALEQAGAAAVTIHARRQHDGPSVPAAPSWHLLAPTVNALSIPVIGNGDVFDVDSAQSMVQQSGVRGVMLARGALRDCSVFSALSAARRSGLLWPGTGGPRLRGETDETDNAAGSDALWVGSGGENVPESAREEDGMERECAQGAAGRRSRALETEGAEAAADVEGRVCKRAKSAAAEAASAPAELSAAAEGVQGALAETLPGEEEELEAGAGEGVRGAGEEEAGERGLGAMRRYVRRCVETENHPRNSRFTMQAMLFEQLAACGGAWPKGSALGAGWQALEERTRMSGGRGMASLARVWGEAPYMERWLAARGGEWRGPKDASHHYSDDFFSRGQPGGSFSVMPRHAPAMAVATGTGAARGSRLKSGLKRRAEDKDFVQELAALLRGWTAMTRRQCHSAVADSARDCSNLKSGESGPVAGASVMKTPNCADDGDGGRGSGVPADEEEGGVGGVGEGGEDAAAAAARYSTVEQAGPGEQRLGFFHAAVRRRLALSLPVPPRLALPSPHLLPGCSAAPDADGGQGPGGAASVGERGASASEGGGGGGGGSGSAAAAVRGKGGRRQLELVFESRWSRSRARADAKAAEQACKALRELRAASEMGAPG